MKKTNYNYKNSYKSDFVFNLVLILVAVVATFAAAKFFSSGIGIFTAKNGIIAYAFAIIFAFSKIAVDTVEKLFCGKFSSNMVALVSILLMFSSKRYLAAAIIAIIFSFCDCVYNLVSSDLSTEIIKQEGELEYLVVTDTSYKRTALSDLKKGDIVVANEGEYLSFSYETQSSLNGKIKVNRPGYFTKNEQALVRVVNVSEYDIVFEENSTPLAQTINYVSYGVCGLFGIFAVWQAIDMYMSGVNTSDCLYTFAKYLLFATPFAYTSGITHLAYIYKKLFLQKGINLSSAADVEKISNVRRVFFSQNAVVTEGKPEIKLVKSCDEYTQEDVLKYCAIATNDIASCLDSIFEKHLPEGTVTQNTSIVNDVGVITNCGDEVIHFGTKKFMVSCEIDTKDLPEYTAFVAVDKKIIGSILVKDNLNPSAIKAMKIAKVLNIKTVLLSADCSQNVEKINNACGFDECYHNLDSLDVAGTLYMANPKTAVAYISHSKTESKDILTVSTTPSERSVSPDSLTDFMKAISQAKTYKFFAFIRYSIAFLINAAMCFVIYKNMFAAKIIYKFTTTTTAMEANVDKFSIKELVYKTLIYNDELAPWLILVVQAVLVIVGILLAVMFNKKEETDNDNVEEIE